MLTGLQLRNFYERYKINPNGLLLWLDAGFPENPSGSTSISYDHSKYNHNGTQSNSSYRPNLTQLENIKAYNFVTDDDIDLSNAPIKDLITNKLTLVSWVYLSSTGNCKIIASDHSSYWVCGIDSSKYNAYCVNSGGGNPLAPTSPTPSTSVWFFYVLVYNNGLWTMYVNGTSIASNTVGSGNLSKTTSQAPGLGAYSGGIQGMSGYISHCNIFNTALSNAEIQQMYNVDKKRYGKL